MDDRNQDKIEELRHWYEEEFGPHVSYRMAEHWYAIGAIRDEDLESPQTLVERIDRLLPDDSVNQDLQIGLIIDYRDEVLELARSHKSSDEHRVANVFYAMWFEHTLNLVLDAALRRRGLTKEHVNQVLRSANNQDKTRWLLRVCGLPALDEDIRSTLDFLFNERNGFVHYKFTPEDPDNREQDVRARNATTRAEAAVSYMRKYKEDALYRGNREKLQQLITDIRRAAGLKLPPGQG